MELNNQNESQEQANAVRYKNKIKEYLIHA